MDKQPDLISRMQDEADLCRNEGASDIAALLDEATEALRVDRVVLAELALKTGELIEHLQNTGRLKPCFYMPALVDARNALRDKLTQAERGHFINTAIAAVRPLTDHDRALTGAKLTDTSGTDF